MTRTVRVYRLQVTYPPRSHWSQPDCDWEWQPEGWAEKWRKAWDDWTAAKAAWEALGPNPDPFGPVGPPEGPPRFDPNHWPGWPVNRAYFSRKAAEARADRFREYGATVTVEASDPVVWPSPEGE